jgi:hypothetical protein
MIRCSRRHLDWRAEVIWGVREALGTHKRITAVEEVDARRAGVVGEACAS